ncbi:hypothetical protein [Klenkia terrae]|uniref:Uncharacterized protein n=1 Tax=Klenkia terrae TaxID=1052259 RepID=A0ABU8E491_9ACTN|nr:hypothetical protein [Klenkia terrae]
MTHSLVPIDDADDGRSHGSGGPADDGANTAEVLSDGAGEDGEDDTPRDRPESSS